MVFIEPGLIETMSRDETHHHQHPPGGGGGLNHPPQQQEQKLFHHTPLQHRPNTYRYPAHYVTPPPVHQHQGQPPTSCNSCSYANNRIPQYQSPTASIPTSSSWQPQTSFLSPQPSAASANDFYPQPTFGPHNVLTSAERNNNVTSSSTFDRFQTSSSSTSSVSMATDTRQAQIPDDPREWTSHDVMAWIEWTCATFKLRNLYTDRFQMNGKALCLMDLSMFLYRVPDGGQTLYQDFQARLQKALCQDKLR